MFQVTFWGVRGSRPVPGKDVLKYGGNTPCVEIRLDKTLIILDAGSGICELGRKLNAYQPVKAHILVTHTHWDHIQGLPFFDPLYTKGNIIFLYGEKKGSLAFKAQIANLMQDPHFPITINQLDPQLEVEEIIAGERIIIDKDVVVDTIASTHPNGSIAYAVHYHGKKCCYLVDFEHSNEPSQGLIQWAKDADLLIYDSNYTDKEYYGPPSRKGWGHSTWQEAVKFAQACGVKKLVLFHHDANRKDSELEIIEKEAQRLFTSCFAAKEGESVTID